MTEPAKVTRYPMSGDIHFWAGEAGRLEAERDALTALVTALVGALEKASTMSRFIFENNKELYRYPEIIAYDYFDDLLASPAVAKWRTPTDPSPASSPADVSGQ